ncbi:MAG TPA: methyltransferase domain-containing protein [Gaiellaceae bacterium]|nr:methyltransferase domain-containing protein [Gaiellaceae bacterium]
MIAPASGPARNEYDHPSIAAAYDAENAWGRDDDFFLALAAETPGSRVLDLGCGTGRLTVALAAAGHSVTGVDPAGAMLAVARTKPGAEKVSWIEGTAAAAPTESFDLALMTSHVAQVFVDDAEWSDTLRHLAGALVPGGRLAFDSRDPAARAWRSWTGVTSVGKGTVSFTSLNELPDGSVLAVDSTLRFRTEPELRASLESAGFAVEAVYGGWSRKPVGADAGELIVVATRGSA